MPIPEHIDIFYLSREMAPVNKTALECVMEVDHERIKLEAEAERLAAVSDDDGKRKQRRSIIEKNLFFFLEKMNNYSEKYIDRQ